MTGRDTSVDRDRRKAAIYAAAGVEVYWILNLVDNQLETHSEPGATSYQSTNVVNRDATVEISLGDVVLPFQLSELFE